MKIAVTSTGLNLDAQVDPRFGRCACFLIIDTESMEFEAVENTNVAAGGGAGVQSGQLIADKDVKFVLTGNCGPNAHRVLTAAGIDVIVGVSGSVREAVEQFNTGAFRVADSPNVEDHYGIKGA